MHVRGLFKKFQDCRFNNNNCWHVSKFLTYFVIGTQMHYYDVRYYYDDDDKWYFIYHVYNSRLKYHGNRDPAQHVKSPTCALFNVT